MTATWFFRPMSPGEMNEDPPQSEFFTTGALERAADALVRETIQNSLDAAIDGNKVRVRFHLSGQQSAVRYEQVDRFFRSLWPHLEAAVNGQTQVPKGDDLVTFVVVEDFQTKGLVGDPIQVGDANGHPAKNDFYYFWRNVARSAKAEKDRGRWGLGKTVFPASSSVRSFFGLTIRDDNPRTLLMGQSILKTHYIGERRCYSYGFFGLPRADGFTEPISDSGLIREFSSHFNLRRNAEKGFSVVIPLPYEEITFAEIVSATVRQFFYAILAGSLEVEAETAEQSLIIDHDNLASIAGSTDISEQDEIAPLLSIAEWAFRRKENDLVTVGEIPQGRKPEWGEGLLPDQLLREARQRFEREEPVAFRVPVWVIREGSGAARSHFDVFLQRKPGPRSYRPAFVREGILISRAVPHKIPGVQALVVVEDNPLATLLGDCENPAHTEWQDRSGHFKGRYKLGASVLRFVKNSVAELVRMLSHSQDEADPTALLDFFFLPEDAEQERRGGTASVEKKRGPETPPQEPDIHGSGQAFRIEHRKGGFSIRPASCAPPLEKIELRVAYDVRRGNPFKRYQRADFELDREPIRIQSEGADFDVTGNFLLIKTPKNDFRISVTGFDPERDLIVRGASVKAEDDSQI